jgi:uncharacterized protein (TIGR02145 family)
MRAICKVLVVFMVVTIFFGGCTKEEKIEIPTVTTINATSITTNTAVLGGNITKTGGAIVIERGLFIGQSNDPVSGGDKKIYLSGEDNPFSGKIGDLQPNIKYYVKAYAINEKGIGYGNLVSFTTLAASAIITTNPIAAITKTSAESGGNVTYDGGASITARGVCWSTTQNPTIENNKTVDGTGKGLFSTTITGLKIYTTYYVRAYATNSVGTVYGQEISFKTLSDSPPTVTSDGGTTGLLSSTCARVGGQVVDDVGLPITEQGIYYGTDNNLETSGIQIKIDNIASDKSFGIDLRKLNPNSVYYLKAYAKNINGIGFGNTITFTTKQKDFVTVNGVNWAKFNLSSPNYFVSHSYDYGMYYQWNRCTGWSYEGTGTYWNTFPDSATWDDGPSFSVPANQSWNWSVDNTINAWQENRDPCPYGWRIPTINEYTQMISSAKTRGWYYLISDKSKRFLKIIFNNNEELWLPGGGYRDTYHGKGECKNDQYAYYWTVSGRHVFAVEYSAIKYYIFDEEYGFLMRCVTY